MSDAWGGASGSAATFDPAVVKQLIADFEKDVDALEKYYNAISVDTMQRREAHKMTRQRAYDTSNRLRALLALPPKNSAQSGEKDRLLAQAQQILNRFTDVTRRTVDIDGEIVHQMRKSLSSTFWAHHVPLFELPILNPALLSPALVLPPFPLLLHFVSSLKAMFPPKSPDQRCF